ncbi:MobC family plasmid mobilization relaxosome protein, partial [Citrobacter cronae]
LGEHVLRRRRVPDVDPALLRQVTGIGNNLNQIARKLHGLDAIPAYQQVSLLAVLTSLDRQLSELLETQRDRQNS